MPAELIQVLLSTYNGERYLMQLLDSLMAQDYPKFEILIRDDGSTDSTKSILELYSKLTNVKIVYGENVGVVGSFFKLMELSSPDAFYISFCDQDDVWEKDKISRAVNLLDNKISSGPGAYCSRVRVVEKNLRELYMSAKPRRGLSFGNALVENIMTGCTIVINKEARDLILQKQPSRALMHDWWIYLVISALGTIVFDEESRILYRQHGANVIGASKGFRRWIGRIQRLVRRARLRPISDQASDFEALYGPRISKDYRETLNRFLNGRDTVWKRLSCSLSGDFYRQSPVDNIILRMLIMANLI